MFKLQIPENFSVVTDEDLASLETQAREAAAPLFARVQAKETLTDDERKGFSDLAKVVQQITEERKSRVEAGTAKAQADRDFSNAVGVFGSQHAAPEDVSETEEDSNADTPEPEAKKVPAKKTGVAAAAKNAPKGDDAVQEDDVEFAAKLVASAKVVNFPAGHVYKNLDEVAQAAAAQFALYPQGAAAAGRFMRDPIMYLQRNKGITITDKDSPEEISRKLDEATNEKNLEGGSLVAAAGWCAPSQIDYSLFELETDAGMLDLPEVQISRGGVQVTPGPDFSTIFSSAGYWHQTEAQVQAATTKPTMAIPCPSFTEYRLQVEGVAITGAFLQDRGYPEMVARFVRGALLAHAHKLNLFKINQLVSLSTLFDYTNTTNLPITDNLYKDQTALSKVLATLDIQAIDYRYKYRMQPTATLEVIMPAWFPTVARMDMQRRMYLTPEQAFSITTDTLNAFFSARNLSVQWVYDWLDAYNTTNTSTVGQSAGVYTLPTTVEALMYPAGTFVAGVAPNVRLDTVYDSTNLALNQYTALFSEESILVAMRGYSSRRIKMNIQPSGTVSASSNMIAG